jgi:mannose-6-phosphate isomerase-like protein (cupin superfamily)
MTDTWDTERLLRNGEGDVLGPPSSCTDRFMIEGFHSGGRFAMVEHTIAPGALAAPMHMHTSEDEFTYVLEGTFAAVLGGREIEAGPGDLVFKPRSEWHTFWNPSEAPTRVLEIISPAGLEQFFRLVDAIEADHDPEQLAEMAARIGCDVDPDATAALVERHGLRF